MVETSFDFHIERTVPAAPSWESSVTWLLASVHNAIAGGVALALGDEVGEADGLFDSEGDTTEGFETEGVAFVPVEAGQAVRTNANNNAAAEAH